MLSSTMSSLLIFSVCRSLSTFDKGMSKTLYIVMDMSNFLQLQFLLCVFWCSVVRCIHIKDCCLSWELTLYHYIVPLLHLMKGWFSGKFQSLCSECSVFLLLWYSHDAYIGICCSCSIVLGYYNPFSYFFLCFSNLQVSTNLFSSSESLSSAMSSLLMCPSKHFSFLLQCFWSLAFKNSFLEFPSLLILPVFVCHLLFH